MPNPQESVSQPPGYRSSGRVPLPRPSAVGKNWYRQAEHWGSAVHPIQTERACLTAALVPDSTRSLLEVGCGDGVVTGEVAKRVPHVVGVDLSPKAVSLLSQAGLVADAAHLPFADASFDTVMACEVIEHLSVADYPVALREFARVARRHVLVTVPNEECLELSFARCPVCGCIFHGPRHLRKFSAESIRGLIPGFRCAATRELCVYLSPDRTTRLELWLRHHIAGEYSYYSPKIDCPTCGSGVNQKPGRNWIGWGLAAMRMVQRGVLRRRQGYWLAGLYERVR